MKKLIIVAFALLACGFFASAASSAEKDVRLKKAAKTTLNVTVDGSPVKVTWYSGCYVSKPNRPEDQKINIYIPQNATKSSPIIFIVNNAGWQADAYPTGTIKEGRDYDGTNDKIGVALKEGYVVVSYGARSRNNGLTDGKYLGHSPATMTDTKAAIRYLRYNRKSLPAGDTERIVVAGTSGGGALSTVIAASGNSEDFFESLYEIGAAGIVRNSDGTYSSEEGVGDNVFAAISYCPITDMGHADAAYEWFFNDVRKALYMAGKMNYSYADEATIMKASGQLSKIYADYIDALGLKDENGEPLDSRNLNSFIERLMRREIELTIKEEGTEQMKADVEQEIRSRRGFGGPGGPNAPSGLGGPGGPGGQAGPQAQAQHTSTAPVQHRENNGWIVFNEDGTFSYNLDRHRYYLALYTALKPAPSFSNLGLYGIGMNEDSLFGSTSDEYCPFNPYSWDNDSSKNGVGKDETGLSWDELMKTEKGKALSLEAKMTCAMAYLLEGKADSAPYWYVRHGMDDRDTSWPVEATLFASIMNSPKVKAHNVGFAWLKPHSGDYDVPEAYAWLKQVLSSDGRH